MDKTKLRGVNVHARIYPKILHVPLSTLMHFNINNCTSPAAVSYISLMKYRPFRNKTKIHLSGLHTAQDSSSDMLSFHNRPTKQKHTF